MQEWWAMFSCFLLSDLSLVGNSGGRVELVDWWPWRKQSDGDVNRGIRWRDKCEYEIYHLSELFLFFLLIFPVS